MKNGDEKKRGFFSPGFFFFFSFFVFSLCLSVVAHQTKLGGDCRGEKERKN